MRGNIGFAWTAPLLAKLVMSSLGRRRAPAYWCCSAEPWRSPVGSSFDESKPVHRPALGILASRHPATGVPQPGDGGAHAVRQRAEPLPDLGDRRALGLLQHADQHRTLGARSRAVSTRTA